MDDYINKNKKVPANVFRVLFYENDENDITFSEKNSAVFSIIINCKQFKVEMEKLQECFQKKVNMLLFQKCVNIVNKNIFFYTNDKEYLNIKNLTDKIRYDLKKSSFKIKIKNNEGYNVPEKIYTYIKEILDILKTIYSKDSIISLYEENLDEDVRQFLSIPKKYFEKFYNKREELLEQYLCWVIYRKFFMEFLLEKLINK